MKLVGDAIRPAALVLVLGAMPGCKDEGADAATDDSGEATEPSSSATEASTLATTTAGSLETATDGGTQESSSGPPPDLPREPAPVTINEVMPDNGSTINGPIAGGGKAGPFSYSTPDWVELVNTGAESIALSRIELRNASNDFWTGDPGDGELAPGERVVVWLGTPQDGAPGLWTGWGVDADDDLLAMRFDGEFVDSVAWTDANPDVSMARIPDGSGERVATAWPTPNAVNGDAPSPTLDAAQETFFRTDVVHRIDFVVTPEISAMLDQPDRPTVHVEATIDGIHYQDVGIGLKGSASYAPMSGKPGFGVDMNQWIEGTEFRGLKAFKLHNGSVIDPTRVRDHITYTLARDLGLLAPRIGWAEVYISGEYYGIYIIVERHDEALIEARRPGAGELGMIFEPTVGWENDFGSFNASWDYEAGPQPLPAAAQATLDAVDSLVSQAPTDERVAQLWDVMDKDLLHAYMAWETIVGHLDGYTGPNNWRVYVDGTTNKVELVPSGAEWTWDFFADVWYFGGNVAAWCIQNQGCRHDYAAKVMEAADRVDALGLIEEFEVQSTFVAPYLAIDPRYPFWGPGSYWYPYGTFEHAYPSTIEHLTSNPMNARAIVLTEFPDLGP